jgi:hypothetical protein
MTALSLNCRDALDDGRPLDTHVCSGCRECPCHVVPIPPDFRERVAAAKDGDL